MITETETETDYIVAWDNDNITPIVLLNVNGEWLPPVALPTRVVKSIASIESSNLRKRLFQACFGLFIIAFTILSSPSRVRAMQSREAVVSRGVVLQAIRERPTREHQLRDQASADEVRMDGLSKRRDHLLRISRRNPRAHPTIEAEVFERGMRDYSLIRQDLIDLSKLWSLEYPLSKYCERLQLELWSLPYPFSKSCDRLHLETERLGSLISYRETTVLRAITTPTQPHDPKIDFHPDNVFRITVNGRDIEEASDNAIAVQMKSVEVAILASRRKQDELYQNQLDLIQNDLF